MRKAGPRMMETKSKSISMRQAYTVMAEVVLNPICCANFRSIIGVKVAKKKMRPAGIVELIMITISMGMSISSSKKSPRAGKFTR